MNVSAHIAPAGAVPPPLWRDAEAMPPLTPDVVRLDDAVRLWAAVFRAQWEDAHVFVTAYCLRLRAEETAKARREFVAFARQPLRNSDVGWFCAVLDLDPFALAEAVHRKVATGWEPIPDHDAWVRDMVSPEGDLLPPAYEVPNAIATGASYAKWHRFGRPQIAPNDGSLLVRAQSRAEFDRLVAARRGAR